MKYGEGVPEVLTKKLGKSILLKWLKAIAGWSASYKYMPQDNLLRMKCTVCKRANYYTSKNKKKVERKLAFKKFCKWCKGSTAHKEARMTG